MRRPAGILLSWLTFWVLAAYAVDLQSKSVDLPGYVLGPEDQVSIRILQAPEIADKPVRIDQAGYIDLPLVNRIRVAGLTSQQLQAELTRRLETYIRNPHVTISIEEFRSQPVSVLGSVNTPGLHQLRGRKTLTEVLSLAGGLRADAGHSVKITRKLRWGPVPVPGAATDPTGEFSIGQVSVKAILEAKNPEQNVLVLPEDVITVPRAEMVYVVGDVEKAGGFVLNERETLTALQSLTLAGGLKNTASPKGAKILRAAPAGTSRVEVPLDLKKVLQGKALDVAMQSDDILFVPSSMSKKIGAKMLDAGISTVTGVVIWRR